MAFGAVLGTLGTNAVSITNPFTATGSVAVSVGDLIVAVLAEQTSLTVTGVTDNLGNTYTAQNAGTDAGSVSGRAFYSRVTNAGTLTGVSAACTASNDNAAFMVAAFSGPFTSTPIDANPANISNDTVTPFTCPATGTLAQAAELVVGWVAGGGSSTAYTATAPNVLVTGQQISSTVATAAIGSQVVAATTTVSPAFATSAPSTDVLGTMSFKQNTAAPPPNGWFGTTSVTAAIAALAIATQATTFAVPPNTNNNITGTGWYQQLSSSAPVAQPQQGFSSVPFNTAQIAPAAPNPIGWLSQTSVAALTATAVPTQATTFAAPAPASNTVSNVAWQQPLSVSAPVAQTVRHQSVVPLNKAQVLPSTPSGWQTTQSSAPARAVINGSGLTFVVAPFAVPSGWQSQLSAAPPVVKAQQGFTSVPFKAATVTTPPPNGWFGPVSTAANVAVAQPTQATTFAVPPQAPAPAVTPGQFGWYQALSKSAPIAVAQQGNAFVPLNTVQAPTPSTAIGVPLIQDSSATSANNVYYQALFNPLRPITQASNTVATVAWQQPLSVAPKTATAALQSTVLTPLTPFQSLSIAWVQPLSKAVTTAQAQTGSISLPFPAAPPTPISGMAWFTPLGTVATSLPTAPQGITFVPFDTTQVTPPPPPPSTEPHWKPFLASMGKLMGMG